MNLRFKYIFYFYLVIYFALTLHAKPQKNIHENTQENNVILISFDGVRPQEFFHQNKSESHLPYFWSTLANKGLVMGPHLKLQMQVSNSTLISLPAYQSIMAGMVTDCDSNDCGRIKVESLAERIKRELQLSFYDVASFSSWEKIPLAFESQVGSVFTNAFLQPVNDGFYDSEIKRINEAQSKDLPIWGGARKDLYTMAQSLRYLRIHKPRFLYISFNDSDEWGHHWNFEEILHSLNSYDRWLNELMSQLQNMPGYGEKTSILITTDHGRGNDEKWGEHGPGVPEARHIWFYGYNPQKLTQIQKYNVENLNSEISQQEKIKIYSHIDLRPTIEALLGLKPQSCEKCGRVISELLN